MKKNKLPQYRIGPLADPDIMVTGRYYGPYRPLKEVYDVIED